MAKVNKKHLLDDMLSEAEKSQLEAFVGNPLMVQAVKKVLLFPFLLTRFKTRKLITKR